jgi:hypothetical protein
MENDVNASILFVVRSNFCLVPLIFPRTKERALVDLEAECSLADRKLHELEAGSSSLKSQLKAKHEELRGMKLLRPAIFC